ncbi:MAG: cyclophilin-like fold protein [Candidatus Helarchaeota archaeon]
MESDELNIIKIRIKILEENAELEGELIRTKNPRTVEAIRDLLPIRGKASIYKENEIYISNIGLDIGREKVSKSAEKGEIAHWPMSGAICFFREKMTPYSEINPVGMITSNVNALNKIKSGNSIIIEKIES